MIDENQQPNTQSDMNDDSQARQPANTSMTDGESPLFIVSNPDPEPAQSPKPKSSRLRYVLTFLGILQIAILVLFFWTGSWSDSEMRAGSIGPSITFLLLALILIPTLAVVSIINLAGSSFYLRKRKPRGGRRIFTIILLAISTVVLLNIAHVIYDVVMIYIKYQNDQSEGSHIVQTQREF